MKKRSLLTLVQWGGVIFLLTLLISCPGSSDIKIHTVTLNYGYDGAPPPEKIEIEDGTVLSPITDPVRDGYQFEGWYTADGTPYNFDTPVIDSFTLTAHWKIKSSGGGGSSAPSEEESLKGQWAVYMEEEGVETPMGNIIDIQHTLPDYWIAVNTSDENHVTGGLIKSDRTGPDKEGRFVVSLDNLLGVDAEMSYSFVDNERNTLKAEVKKDDITAMTFILERIPSEEEIKMHIVSFKLDESIESTGYTIHSELAAVKDGTSFGDKGWPILELNGAEVPALFTLADGTKFTEDTPVTDDIVVTVTPPGEWNGIHYVSTKEELLAWANALKDDPSLDCVLLDNIELTDTWSSLGLKESYSYAGTFDGGGYKIRGLEIEAQGNPNGLFSAISEGAVVKNLTIEASFTDTSGYSNLGVVAGQNNGTIENCHSIINNGTSASGHFGGIAATNKGSIIGCSSIIKGSVSGSYVGGIAGYNMGEKSTIAASFMILEENGSLSSTSGYCAGIVGNNGTGTAAGSVTGCYSVINGTISDDEEQSYAIALGGNRTDCYWSSNNGFTASDTTGVTEVDGTTTWDVAMTAMNAAITDSGYQFEKNTGTDAGTIPLIIVSSSI